MASRRGLGKESGFLSELLERNGALLALGGGLLDSCAPAREDSQPVGTEGACGSSLWPGKLVQWIVLGGHTQSRAPWGVGAGTRPGKCPPGCGQASNLIFECDPY